MLRLFVVLVLASCNQPASPSTSVELQNVTDPAVIAAVSETLAALDLQLADTPRAGDRVRLRMAALEQLRPLVKPSGARALAEVRSLVLSGAAFEKDMALADREAP